MFQFSIPRIRYFICLVLHITGFCFGFPDASRLMAQDVMVKGRVLDSRNHQPLFPVTIIATSTRKGTITNDSGVFVLRVPPGNLKLQFSFTGYEKLDTSIFLKEEGTITFLMTAKPVQVDEVTVTAEGTRDRVHSDQMGVFTLSSHEIKSLPSLLGESDPLKLLQLTPGVQGGSEGGIGYYVRGGGTDQNLILFDNNLVYNPGHLLGFFSLFNPEVVKDISILKSGIPAQYGGKLSSVINLNSFKGNTDSLRLTGSIGLIATRAALGGPFAKGKGSFIIAARKTYLGLVVEPVVQKLINDQAFFIKNSQYDFYDFNAGGTYRISPSDLLSFSSYLGRDKFSLSRSELKQKNRLQWGNTLSTLQWTHKPGWQQEFVSSISWTKYQFDLQGAQSKYFFGLFSSVQDITFKSHFTKHRLSGDWTAGMELSDHRFIPNKIDAQAGNFILNFNRFSTMHAMEAAIFLDEKFNISPRLSATAGLRLSCFDHMGPYREIKTNSIGRIIDTLDYPAGQSLALYFHPEPRLIFNYEMNDDAVFKASYMRIAQYIHLATSASVSLPTDIWMPSTSNIKPVIGDQLSLGYFRNLYEKNYEFSLELYYKKMKNQLEFLRGIINNSITGTLEDNIATGDGQAYGTEIYLRKKKGLTTGWISYTLARTELQFDQINEGKIYPAKYDRRHEVSVTLIREINPRWNCSSVFVFVSGNAFTLPSGRYIIQGSMINQYGPVNAFRMPPYHRLDISVTRKILLRGKYSSELIFSVYNVYNRANPYYITYEVKGDLQHYSLKVVPVQVSLFPVIPSISWNFNF